MITVDDLKEAIAECEGERHPNSSTCIKLMAYYYLLDQYAEKPEMMPMYSNAAEPIQAKEVFVADYGDGELFPLIKGKAARDVWQVMNELFSTLGMVNKPLHDSAKRKLEEIQKNAS